MEKGTEQKSSAVKPASWTAVAMVAMLQGKHIIALIDLIASVAVKPMTSQCVSVLNGGEHVESERGRSQITSGKNWTF